MTLPKVQSNIFLAYLKEIRKCHTKTAFSFVPRHNPTQENDINTLRNFINTSRKIVVVTGAGISTESGIPDYRSEEVGLYARSNHKPIQYQEYLRSPKTRQRYWARNFIGWPRFSSCEPNSTHNWVRDLEKTHGKVSCVVTQNVDGLHYKAGSSNVIELHGSAFRVFCLNCGVFYDRHDVQERMRHLNPDIRDGSLMIRPDGDVEIPQETVNNFKTPTCLKCEGILKPDIVFFGDNVPRTRVEAVKNSISESDSVLVLGSSLFVFSGFRIILQAIEEKKNVAIVNIGPTRADSIVPLKISAKCGDILPKIFVD